MLPNLHHDLLFVLQEQEHQVEDGRGDVGSNSTSLVGCAAETGAKTGQTEALSITSETDILDSSSPAGEASVIDYASPAAAAFPSADASGGFAQRPAEGNKQTHSTPLNHLYHSFLLMLNIFL